MKIFEMGLTSLLFIAADTSQSSVQQLFGQKPTWMQDFYGAISQKPVFRDKKFQDLTLTWKDRPVFLNCDLKSNQYNCSRSTRQNSCDYYIIYSCAPNGSDITKLVHLQRVSQRF